ncbi:MAG: alginate O-acetyltransferase complex protein AlgI [Flammeovirgaceae bacterium]|jgi:alginate O-acetyltransferase complex protein AlgI
MLFNSLDYLIFLPLVIVAFYLIPHRFRWVLLLAASYYFYMCWKWQYIFLIVISTMVDFYAGLQIAKTPDKKKKRWFLLLSLFVNLGFLFYFKYFNFFSENTAIVLSQFNILTNFEYYDILLPIGISFYTFQTLSYTIDVYQGRSEPETHLGYFALYVAYFPQLVAGPIERSSRLLPQLKRDPDIAAEDIRYGVNKILLGFFKKLVVADTVARYVNAVYANVEGATGTQLYLASFLFGVQIFADFSGYTDIAMGSARLMGVKLMENFYRSMWTENHTEHWARWHMSLTSWIRDYVYIPLKSISSSQGALVLWSFFILALIGFWHGANWTFIMFGVLNGCVMLIQRMIQPTIVGRIMRTNQFTFSIQKFVNLNIIVLEGIYFRSIDLDMAHNIYGKIFTEFSLDITQFLSMYKFDFLTSVGVSCLLWVTALFNTKLKFKYNWLYITTMLFLILLLGQDSKNQFIYFQF